MPSVSEYISRRKTIQISTFVKYFTVNNNTYDRKVCIKKRKWLYIMSTSKQFKDEIIFEMINLILKRFVHWFWQFISRMNINSAAANHRWGMTILVNN